MTFASKDAATNVLASFETEGIPIELLRIERRLPRPVPAPRRVADVIGACSAIVAAIVRATLSHDPVVVAAALAGYGGLVGAGAGLAVDRRRQRRHARRHRDERARAYVVTCPVGAVVSHERS